MPCCAELGQCHAVLSWAAAVPASVAVTDAHLPCTAVTRKRHHRRWWRVVSAGSALPPSVVWRWLTEGLTIPIGGRLLACSNTDVVGPTGRRFGARCVLLVAALHVPRGRNGADHAPGGTCMRHECGVRLGLQQMQWLRLPGQACNTDTFTILPTACGQIRARPEGRLHGPPSRCARVCHRKGGFG